MTEYEFYVEVITPDLIGTKDEGVLELQLGNLRQYLGWKILWKNLRKLSNIVKRRETIKIRFQKCAQI